MGINQQYSINNKEILNNLWPIILMLRILICQSITSGIIWTNILLLKDVDKELEEIRLTIEK